MPNLATMTKPVLKKIAADKGIAVPPKAKNKEIVALIEQHEQPAKEGKKSKGEW